jgi:4-hydroxybenzoate polyprenyltransferase
LIKLIRFFNTLSFDTAFGAVSFVYIISCSQHLKVSFIIYIALLISVLSIYNIDHLLDAIKLDKKAESYRHYYYQKNFKVLIFWQLILLFFGVITLFYLPIEVIIGGIIMLLSMTIYFWIIFNGAKKNLIFREIIVAFGYVVAVSLIPFLDKIEQINLNYLWLLLIVFFIALSNLWIFSIYDFEVDHLQNHHSIARALKKRIILNLVRITVIFSIISTVGYAFYYNLWFMGGVLLFTEFIYLLLVEKQLYFSKNEYYRLVGEVVLILPGGFLLIYNAI